MLETEKASNEFTIFKVIQPHPRHLDTPPSLHQHSLVTLNELMGKYWAWQQVLHAFRDDTWYPLYVTLPLLHSYQQDRVILAAGGTVERRSNG